MRHPEEVSIRYHYDPYSGSPLTHNPYSEHNVATDSAYQDITKPSYASILEKPAVYAQQIQGWSRVIETGGLHPHEHEKNLLGDAQDELKKVIEIIEAHRGMKEGELEKLYPAYARGKSGSHDRLYARERKRYEIEKHPVNIFLQGLGLPSIPFFRNESA